jgi:hypothetical protein
MNQMHRINLKPARLGVQHSFLLWLTEWLASALDLPPGMRVLDREGIAIFEVT